MRRSHSYLYICALWAGCLNAAAQSTVFNNPSFENDEQEWTLRQEDGAEGRLVFSSEARTGRRALRIEKTNGLGSLVLVQRHTVPVKPGTDYEVFVNTRLIARQFGAQIRFHNQDLRADGSATGPVIKSPYYNWLPVFPSKPREWNPHRCRWTTAPNASAAQITFRLDGGPITLLLDDFALIERPPSLARTGKTDSHEPPYNEAAARANLAKRQAEPAWVKMINGRPTLLAGDNFRTALTAQIPSNPRHAGFASAGVHVQSVSVWLGAIQQDPEHYDFSRLEQSLLKAVGADPEVRIVLVLGCSPNPRWTSEHPEEVWTADNGERWISYRGHPSRLGSELHEGEHYSVSYGSPAYRETMEAPLRALGRWVRTNPAGKLVVGFSLTGGNDGQWYDESQVFDSILQVRPDGTPVVPGGVQLDHSPGHNRGFRLWLQEKYHNSDAELRAAWGDPAVTFESATICREAERAPDHMFLRRSEQRVMDSNLYAHIAPARLVKSFAATLKAAIGRPVFSMTYYPDASEGYRLNKHVLQEMLGEPHAMDSVTEVQAYGSWRKLGGTGGTAACWGSHRLRGKLHISEIDYRTYRSPWGTDWHGELMGVPETAEGFRAQIRRDIGATASRGMAAWFYDIGQGGFYDDPRLWSVISEARRMLDWAHSPDTPKPAAEMAVFIDQDVSWRLNTRVYGELNSTNSEGPLFPAARQRLALNQAGVPYDMYLLDDIRRPDLPEYKVYVFLSAFTLTRAQAAAIQERCRKPGKIVVLPATTGQGSFDYADAAALIRELTGIRGEILPAGTSIASVPAPDCRHRVCRNLDAAFVPFGISDMPFVAPRDPDATVLGKFTRLNRPSHVLKTSRSGTAVLVPPFVGDLGGLNPQFIQNLASMAGIRTLASPGQVTYVGNGVAVSHRINPGPAKVVFDGPVDLFATDGRTSLARGVREWIPETGMLGTDAVLYRSSKMTGGKNTDESSK